MSSNTNNVKLGPCKVFFGGVDLGYTQGGVDVEVKTDTHEIMVDQFGKSVINEIITGRTVTVKVPMAETTLENLVRIMPGAVIVETGGVKATGTVTFSAIATAADTVTLNGIVYTASALTGAALPNNSFSIGSTPGDQATKFAAVVNGDENTLQAAVATVAGAVVTLTADDFGTGVVNGVQYQYGNAYTMSKVSTAVTLSGATITGGVVASKVRVDVPTAIGSSLLAIAQMLVLHPTANADTNRSEDFIIPLAATSGGLSFAYQLEKERIYNVTFKAYPNSSTANLYSIGDSTAA